MQKCVETPKEKKKKGKISHSLKRVTANTRSSTSKATWRARPADPGSDRAVPRPASFGSRDNVELSVWLSASRMPFQTFPHL